MSEFDAAMKLDIVLAEDDPDQAALNKRVLENAGHRVEVAPDGAAAIRAVENHDPDLLVLDMEMPRGTGLEVLEDLRSRPATEQQPVVVLSNKEPSPNEERRLLLLGALDYLPKWKVEPKVLVGWIRGWAAARIRRTHVRG